MIKKLQSLIIFVQACALLIFAGYVCFFKETFQPVFQVKKTDDEVNSFDKEEETFSDQIKDKEKAVDNSVDVLLAKNADSGFYGSKKGAFISLTTESALSNCSINGEIPEWLKGTFFLTGPAQFDLGQTTIKYWFNGVAMLHSFSLSNNTVHYKNAFLKSDFYNHCMKEGKFDQGLSADSKKPSFFSKIGNVFKSNKAVYDNANMAIWQFNGQLCALTETPEPVIFDPASLAVQGHMVFDDKIEAHMATAQPLYDAKRQCWYNIYTHFGTTTTYAFCSLKEGSQVRSLVAEISTKLPSYIRSFGMTENFLILIETPYVVRPLDLLTNPSSFIDNLRWENGRKALFTVIHKDKGTVVGKYATDAFFMFNALNAYEHNNEIHLDIAAYKDASIVGKTEISALRADNNKASEPAYLWRYMLDLKTKKIKKMQLSDAVLEMPEINKAYSMREYAYCYGLSSNQPYDFHNQLVKIEVKTGKAIVWQEPGCFPTKPTFVPNPKAKAEDDGVLLSVVFDSNTKKSALVILQADTLKKIAQIDLPHHIPLGLSGNFYAL